MKNRLNLTTILMIVVTCFCPFETKAQCTPSLTEICGVVFRDYDWSGIQNDREPGVYNVTVSVYAAGSTTPTATGSTAEDGSYTITGLTASTPYRVEFTWPFSYLSPGPSGGTSVQFLQSGNPANLGLSNPGEYTPANFKNTSRLFTPCYVLGPSDVDIFDDLSIDNTTRDAIVMVDYTDRSSNTGTPFDPGSATSIATHGQVGATFGLVHDPVNEDLYAAAYLKRHTGFGPSGPSAIYKIDLDNGNTVSTWYTDGANFGNDPHPAAGTMCLDYSSGGGTGEFECWLYDISTNASTVSESYNLQGKMSWGDVDITEDYKNVVGVNLATKELYIIPILASGAAGTATKTTIPMPGCTGGDADNWRPMGLGVQDNKVYVGGVCSGESNQERNDMAAYVYYYDLTTNSWNNTPVLTFDFQEGMGTDWGACWEAWLNTDNWDVDATDADCSSEMTKYYQPLITDIEFDNGDMIIGIKDRNGDILGDQARPPIYNATDGTGEISGITRGYIARACYNDATNTFVLESSGGFMSCSGLQTDGDTEGRLLGPGEGEYYWGQHQFQDTNDATDTKHQQSTWGGLYQIPGCADLGSTTMNPIDDGGEVSDGGIMFLSNDDETVITYQGVSGVLTAGTKTFQARIYDGSPDPAAFDKSGGLGDLEGTTTLAPIEIGNFVWEDTNDNGIQDAGELPIAGLTVELLLGTTVIATAMTDANGNYIFSNNPLGSTTNSHIYNITQLIPNETYTIRVPTSTTTTTGALSISMNPDNDNTTNGDIRDTDFSAAGTLSITTQSFGENDHTFDVGYVLVACILEESGLENEVCNNNATDPAVGDDYITFDLSPTGTTGIGTTYSVTVNNGGVVTQIGGAAATNIAYADNPTSFRLQNGSADGTTTYTITITDDVSGTTCMISEMLDPQDACSVCSVTVEAGTPTTICATTESVDLSTIGAGFTPNNVTGFSATWSTSGSGTFTGGTDFNSATAYVPSATDVQNGEVTLTLTTDDPMAAPFNNTTCGPVSDSFTVTILQVNCGTFPWGG